MKRIWILLVISIVACTVTAFMVKGGRSMKIEVDGGIIYGELDNHGKEAVVLIVAGSGQTDRNGNSEAMQGRNDSFIQLSEALGKKGISSFRYDKRSAGKSAGTFDSKTQVYFEDFVNDLNACIAGLKEEGYEKIILAGHSQGSLISMLAAGNSNVDGIISISGTGFPIGETMIKQYAAQLGEDAPVIGILRNLMGGIIDEEAAKTDPLFSIPNQKFLLSWMKYNPVEILGGINKPVLILQGDADLQVTEDDFKALCSVDLNNEYGKINNMNHVLKYVESIEENVKSYSDPSFELNEELVERIAGFLGKFD